MSADSVDARTRVKRARLFALVAVVAMALLLTGCANIAKPDGWARPVIVDGTLYASLNGGKLSALDAESYQEKWEFPAADEFACGNETPQKRDLDGIYGAPLVIDDSVYIGAYDGRVYAINKPDGTCEWTFKTGDPVVAGLVSDGERLYVASTDGYLYVLDPATGEELQRVAAGDIWSTPLLTAAGDLYVSTMDGKLWKFRTDPLEPAWTPPFEVSAGLLTAPVLAGDTVMVGGIGRTLFGVNAETGEQKWSVSADNWFWGEPAADPENASDPVFTTNLSGQVFRVDPSSGDRSWEADAQAPVRAGAVVADGKVVVVNDAGLVTLLNPGDGAMVDTIDLETSVYATPLDANGSVLILARNGSLFSVDIESGRATEVVD